MRQWAAACCAALAACSASPPAPPLPPPAPQTVDTDYFDPPSDRMVLQSRAVGRVWDELSPRFAGLESHSQLFRPGTARGAVIAHYVSALPGWTPIPVAQPRWGWAFGLARGDCVLAVLAIVPGAAQQPAAVVSNLRPAGASSSDPRDADGPRSCG